MMNRRNFIKLSAIASIGFCLPLSGKKEKENVPILRTDFPDGKFEDYNITSLRMEAHKNEPMMFYITAVERVSNQKGLRGIMEVDGHVTKENMKIIYDMMEHVK